MTPKQIETLTILQEECAEVIQAASKIIRFENINDLDHLALELSDLLCMIQQTQNNFEEITNYNYLKGIEHKKRKLNQFSKYICKD